MLNENDLHDRRRRQRHHLRLRRHRPADAGDAARRPDHHLRLQRGRRPHRSHQQRHARPVYASNADNEITQVGSATYTYDANGNLHTVTDSSGTTTYTYNDLNQLVSITAPDGTVTTFQYSPLGFLVGTSTSERHSQTNYLVDPTGLGNIVASYTGSGIADRRLQLRARPGQPDGPERHRLLRLRRQRQHGRHHRSSGTLRQPVQLSAVRRDDDRLGGAAEPVHVRRTDRRPPDRQYPVLVTAPRLFVHDGTVHEQCSE